MSNKNITVILDDGRNKIEEMNYDEDDDYDYDEYYSGYPFEDEESEDSDGDYNIRFGTYKHPLMKYALSALYHKAYNS
jgi:hypothetical protein